MKKIIYILLLITTKQSFGQTTIKSERLEIICDSIYSHKDYKVTLTTIDSTNQDETKANAIFILYKLTDGKYKKLFSDSIFRHFENIRFADFNNDNVKDILVENISDVRSNMTYYLYLVDTTHDKLKKINGFEEIKNPNFLPKYNLIDCYVMSGEDWTNFYKIKGDSIKDFDIVIYDDHTENGTYERAYKKAIKTILTREKNNH